MDKKLRNKILYIIVGVLWSVAIYRTYNNYQVKSENEEIQSQSISSFSPIAFNKDTFDLILPNQDPFLRSGYHFIRDNGNNDGSQNGNNNTSHVVKVKEPVVPVAPKKWPSIEYFGFILNRDQDKTLCMLKIDGKSIKLPEGDSEYGIYFTSVFRDSVYIVFEGEEKTFFK